MSSKMLDMNNSKCKTKCKTLFRSLAMILNGSKGIFLKKALWPFVEKEYATEWLYFEKKEKIYYQE